MATDSEEIAEERVLNGRAREDADERREADRALRRFD